MQETCKEVKEHYNKQCRYIKRYIIVKEKKSPVLMVIKERMDIFPHFFTHKLSAVIECLEQ